MQTHRDFVIVMGLLKRKFCKRTLISGDVKRNSVSMRRLRKKRERERETLWKKKFVVLFEVLDDELRWTFIIIPQESESLPSL